MSRRNTDWGEEGEYVLWVTYYIMCGLKSHQYVRKSRVALRDKTDLNIQPYVKVNRCKGNTSPIEVISAFQPYHTIAHMRRH